MLPSIRNYKFSKMRSRTMLITAVCVFFFNHRTCFGIAVISVISGLTYKRGDRVKQYTLGDKYRVCRVYSPEPRSEVYCFNLNLNISKLVYSVLY